MGNDTVKQLIERQKWPLNQKIDHALGVIEQFHNRLDGKVYVAFSGGKDSTVLYWLARKVFPNIKAVFCNTRNELPEIVKFVLTMKRDELYNIDIITPAMTPKQVIESVGSPLVSKRVAELVSTCRHNPDSKTSKVALSKTAHDGGIAKKYQYLLDAKYDCSALCCDYLKKRPMHEYDLKNSVSPILGTMACESRLRLAAYIKAGSCNTFNNRDKRKQKSRPLSIWLEQDIWDCINKYKIPICDIYYKGFDRTGCACCGFGAQFNDDNRFEYVYNTHPKLYDYFMAFENNGVSYKDALRDMLAINGGCLPDEKPIDLFST